AELGGGAFQPLADRAHRLAGLLGDAVQAAQRRADPPLGAAVAGQLAVGGAERLQDLLAAHQPDALGGERFLLAGLRVELAQLAGGVAQPVLLALRALEFGLAGFARGALGSPVAPRFLHARSPRSECAIGVQPGAMGRRVLQALLLELAFDLDERIGQRSEERRVGKEGWARW